VRNASAGNDKLVQVGFVEQRSDVGDRRVRQADELEFCASRERPDIRQGLDRLSAYTSSDMEMRHLEEEKRPDNDAGEATNDVSHVASARYCPPAHDLGRSSDRTNSAFPHSIDPLQT
jgi:hypothetical protein